MLTTSRRWTSSKRARSSITRRSAALNRAKELCHLPDLTADSAAEWLEVFQAKELEATEKMLSSRK
ncbi:hypothetical protein ACLB1R_14105 [Escherichia coli]